MMLGIILIAITIYGAVLAALYRETRIWSDEIQEAEGRRLASMLAAGVESLFDTEGAWSPAATATIARRLERAAREGDVQAVAVVDRSHKVIALANSTRQLSAAIMSRAGMPLDDAEVVIHHDGSPSIVLIPIRARSQDSAAVGPAVATLFVEAAPTSITAIMVRMSWRIGALASGVALVGVVLAFALSRRLVLRPTHALAAQAARFAAGDLDARSGLAPTDDCNELVGMGRILDTMAARIGEDMRLLQAADERHRQVVENAVEGIFTTDAHGIVLDLNPSAHQLIRRSREEVCGHTLSEFLHPDEVPALGANIERVLAGEVVLHEWRLQLPDGTYLPVEVSAIRLPDGRIQGITRDISRRKHAEDELRRLMRQQRSVAELGQHALAHMEMQQLMNEAVALIAERLGTPYGTVLELLPDDPTLRVRAAVGWSPDLLGPMSAKPDSQAGFTLLSDAPVVSEDLKTETRFRDTALAQDSGIVSGLSVVIRRGVKPFGVLAVYATERRHFTPDDVHFVETVANVLAQAVARNETEEALRLSEQRYRLAARASRDAIYDWDIARDQSFWSDGMTLLFGHLPEAVGSGLEWWSSCLHPDDREAVLRGVNELLTSREPTWRAEYRFRRADGSYASVNDRGYVEYAADGTPLRAVGAMTDVTEEKRAEDALRRQVGFVELSREVAVTANGAGDVPTALRATLSLVCRHTGWPLGRALLLNDGSRTAPATNVWHLEDPARFGRFRVLSENVVVRRGVGMLGAVWESGRPVWMAEGGAPSPRRAAALASGLRSGFACPILVGATVVGILEFWAEDSIPPADDLMVLMGVIGTQLGRVIERAHAEERLRDYADRLETLSRRVIEAQETERRHVARELHDEIGQALTALKLNLQSISAGVARDSARVLLEESILLADQTLQQTRDLSLDLRPAVLDDLGLIPALRWYLDRQGRRAGFDTEFAATEIGDAVPSEVATTCFRIAQEALTNVARHAHASKVSMALSRRDSGIELEVRDSGRGFDRELATASVQSGRSLGLISMGERAALVGGTLTIDSVLGQGTVIRVHLPLPADRKVNLG